MNRPTIKQRKHGFTLIELVIVVLVLGIIAAAASPKLFDTAGDARDSSTRHSLSVLRSAIELYRSTTGSYPNSGSIGTDLLSYLQGPFPETQAGTNKNASVAVSSADPIVAVVSGGAGWVYNSSTGEIRVNDASYLSW